MSKNASPSNAWSHRALNLALLALGVMVMALLYALVSQSFGSASSPAPVKDASTSKQTTSKQTAATEAPPTDDIIQVAVRNGCGEPDLAAQTRGYLVRAGFDVVEVGNYSSFDVDSSMVIDRVGNRAAALRVARALGIPARRVRQDLRPEYYLDASVILGSDYATLKPFRDEEEAASISLP